MEEVKDITEALGEIANHLIRFHVINAPVPLALADLETTLVKSTLSQKLTHLHHIGDYSHTTLKPVSSFVARPKLQLRLERLMTTGSASDA